MEERGRGRDWVREAFTPKMIVLFIFLAIAAGVCIRLGYWQLERATARGAERITAEHQERLNSPAEPLADVLRAQTNMTSDEYARPVYVTGTFDENQLRVLDRAVNGEPADLILAEFTITEGPDAGARAPIIRGWVEPGTELPSVPDGEVTVFGYLAAPEDSIGGLTDETALSISPAELVNAWGGPILSGYIVEFTPTNVDPAAIDAGETISVTAEATSPDGVRHASAPKPTEEGGFNLQNAAYAVEWVVFAGFALFIWFRILRSTVHSKREERMLDKWAEEFLTQEESSTSQPSPESASAGSDSEK